MSRLEELIEELCPDGVEYIALADLFDTRNGYTPSKGNSEYWENGIISWFRMEDIRENGSILDDAIQHVTNKAVKGEVFPENSIIISTSATIGEHALIRCKSLANQRFTYLMIKDNYKKKYDIKFIFYYCYILDKWCKNNLNQGNFASVDMNKFQKFLFPLPPLEVQHEIVRILDNFTELTAELTAELTTRKKQYEYYRDELLGFDHNTFMVELSEVACYSKDRIDACNIDDNSYIGVDNLLQNKQGKTLSSYTPTEGRLTKYNNKDILIGNIRPYLKKIWFATNDGGTNGDVLVIRTTSEVILPEYLYCVLSSDDFFNYDMQNAKGAKMPRGNKEAIMKYKFALPSITEQKKIIVILNRFEVLCNDISEGLPAEIEARQKQYEYYRDKLLTFKELGARNV